MNQLPDNTGAFIKRFGVYAFFCILPCLILLALYLWIFGSLSLSPSFKDWVDFATVFNLVVTVSLGLGNLLLLYSLTRVANEFQRESLQKQLKFELYKDFIAKLDDFTIQGLSKVNFEDSENEQSKVRADSEVFIKSIRYLALSAQVNFAYILDETSDNQTFGTLCEDLANKSKEFSNNYNRASMLDLTDSIKKVKQRLFQEVTRRPEALIRLK